MFLLQSFCDFVTIVQGFATRSPTNISGEVSGEVVFCYNRTTFLLQSLYDFATIEQKFCYDISDEIIRQNQFCYNSTTFSLQGLRQITVFYVFVTEPFFAIIV
jgi:hypothetical protein